MNSYADVFIPDNHPADARIAQTTHLAVCSHQDDIEIMAYHGIINCFGRSDKWFTGVVVTNGSSSAREGLYAEFTDEQMVLIRNQEQKKAAYLGEYGALISLNYSSSAAKCSKNTDIVEDLVEILLMARPQNIYLHNLADKHETHIGVGIKTIKALRETRDIFIPETITGCEVWGSLDWLVDEDKIKMDVSMRPNISMALLGVHDSQISGGKRYDLATRGRYQSNATYQESHNVDQATAVIYGMDLRPLVMDSGIEMTAYIQNKINRFEQDTIEKLTRCCGLD